MIERYLLELWQILLELSPSLLLGLFIAGLMHAYLPAGMIHRGLNRPGLGSVTRASLIGVPLPLCSCGVVPAALGLRKEGASPGATTSFLISTPQTGVDSILVSAAFLGWPFAVFKVVAAFVTGIVGGLFVNRFVPGGADPDAGASGAVVPERRDHRLAGALRYAVFDLLGAIDLWLIAGVLAAALVTTLTPSDFFTAQPWSQGLLGMLVVLAISVPLYVCTTASVPLAASLIAAGMPAGSALVFLMAGPATNAATIGAVYRTLGGRVLILYLGTVVLMSLAFGLFFDSILSGSIVAGQAHVHGADRLSLLPAFVLLGLLALLAVRRLRARAAPPSATDEGASMVLQVSGMTCQHCAGSVKQSLEALDSVREASADLASGRVCVRGESMDPARLTRAVEQAGFAVKSIDESAPAVDARRAIE